MIAAMRWTAPDQAAAALTRQPVECLRIPDDPAERRKVEIGRAAFRTPMLLGGQAARLGLTCESCHGNGRNNPAFLFPGLSDAPGTADVTNALMSTHRDNGVFDPRPIPDLAAPGKISRRADVPDLRNFIRGLIVEEFDGNEPAPAVLDGLTAYVRAIDLRSCSPTGPSSLTAAWSDAAVRAAAAAHERLNAGDTASVLLMLSAARTALGKLDQRYAHIAADHRQLLRADAELSDMQKAIEHGSADVKDRLARWPGEAAQWKAALLKDEARSLFNPTIFNVWLRSRRTQAPTS